MANEKNLTEETTEVVTDEVAENTGTEGTVPKESENVTIEKAEDKTGDSRKLLVAVYPILFLSHQYKVGEALPANYPNMADAWLQAGTAAWKTVEQPTAPKAKPATAEPGLPGDTAYSEDANVDNLVGKVPQTASRRRK